MLNISRDDISGDIISEYPVSTRFIKLSVAAYLKLLPAIDPVTYARSTAYDELNRPQTALINAVNNPKYRFVCAALSRRLGKTYIANVIGQLVELVPGCNVLIMSPNYSLSAISFELQRKLIKSFDLEVEKDNLKDKVIELANGSTIRMGSISTVDSSVGRSYDLIIFDEAALSSGGKEAFNVALRPTLDKPNSKAIFISTPRGRSNWFCEFFDRGFSSQYPEWVSIQADYTENTRMTAADVAEARNSMSKAEFAQEYMASFTTFEGQIYTDWSESYIAEFTHSDGCEYIAGLDPGYRDPTALVVVAYDPKLEQFHVVDEYLESQATTQQHAAIFSSMCAKWGTESIFIDSAAAQFASDLAYIYDISTIRAKKQVLEGIAYVQTIIESKRLRVAPHCTHTLAMLNGYRWKTDAASGIERPDHDQNSHIADALRYALYTYTL